MPATGKSTLETSTMFCGFVGLTAIVSSDSFVCRWLMSTLVGVLGWAAPGTTRTPETTSADNDTTAAERPRRIPSPFLGLSRVPTLPPPTCAGKRERDPPTACERLEV